jgi:plasmid stability protein
MASISVRKLDDQVYRKLCVRAAKHGLSMEEEVRQIISQVVSAPAKISSVFRKNFGSKHGVDLIQGSERSLHDPMDI